ncbi:hypothetical protein L3Q67_01755 [Saccharothrix sp. AJ9571]|nr:hypothetical protein L3Q67_01755 [Saccharothrix sp. AJ9571]
MTGKSGSAPRRRRRRSTAALERLEAARRRRAEQLERERENEQRVDEALTPFAEAATAIEGVERRRDDRLAALTAQLERKLAALERQRAAKVAEHERLVEQLRVDAEMEIAELRRVMGVSVRQIRAADVSVTDAAGMLGIPAKAVSALAREVADDEAAGARGGTAASDSTKASALFEPETRQTGDEKSAAAVPDSATDRAGPVHGESANQVVKTDEAWSASPSQE